MMTLLQFVSISRLGIKTVSILVSGRICDVNTIHTILCSCWYDIQRKTRALFVDVQRVELEISILECRWVVVYIINTCRWTSRLGVNWTCPVSAECKVDDNVLRSKMSGDIAISIGKVCGGCPPMTSIDARPRRLDVTGNRATRPLPKENLDVSRTLFYRIPATPVAVKLRPIALVVVDMDPTPRIAVSVCVAVRTTDDAWHWARRGHCAIGARVQTACIGSLIIHAFYNVDFASVRPVFPHFPVESITSWYTRQTSRHWDKEPS